MTILATRYADALADVAIEQNAAAHVREQLQLFLQLQRESPDLSVLLESPAVPRASKRAVVEALVARMGASRIVRNFLFVVLDRRRTALLPEIVRAFDERLDERQGTTRAEVTSARELNVAERTELQGTLERLTGRRVQTLYELDPELIAGAVVRIGSTIYDGSVRAQLERLRVRLASS